MKIMSSDGCNIIEHYQKSIKKARNDETKLLYCIGKLDALPITIDHLQRTGVGKTINSLRKYNGAVGDAAKVLVTKWKNMVASGEVTSSSPEKHNEYSLNPVGCENTSKQNVEVREIEARVINNGKHKEEKSHPDRQKDTRHKEEKNHSHSRRDSNQRDEKRHSDTQKNSYDKEKQKKYSDTQRKTDHRIEKDTLCPLGSSNQKEEKKDWDTNRNAYNKITDILNQQDQHHESKSSKRKSHSKEKDNSHKSFSRNDEKCSSNSSKSSSNKSSSKRPREEASSSKTQKESIVSGEVASKRNCDEASEKYQSKAKKQKVNVKDEIEIDSSMGASFSDALGMCGIGGNSKKSKRLQKIIESKPVTENPNHSKSFTEKQNDTASVDLVPDALKITPKTKLDLSLNLPISSSIKITDNYKPSPMNLNVMNCIYPSSVPEKSTNFNLDSASVTQFNPKTMRTKVYSGVKTGALLTVPTLFDICIRVLQKNIDALEYTGGVPFDVLRPVLERTTPQQLLNFEDYNAYLLEDTDVLWQQHVGRHFRGQKREEGETWREMFLRCEDEKERRLNILTKNIKISQKQSALPIKKTRLAYVDNVVKPPRNIQRKQELYGTNDKLIASPAARVAALSAMSHNTVVAGDPRLKIGRDFNSAATGNNPLRIKKAPLMAKTLQFIKKTYKR